MTTTLSSIIASRLEKAATDNGFDQELEREGDWLVNGHRTYLPWHRERVFRKKPRVAST